MYVKRCRIPLVLLLAVCTIICTADRGFPDLQAADEPEVRETQKSAYQRRREANERLDAWLGRQQPKQAPAAAAVPFAATPTGINPMVDINLPNFANSPNLRKFVDSLPGLGSAGASTLGNYVSVAVPDTTTYPGSDYYELAVVCYTQKMHSDLPLTDLRGYVQIETPANAAVSKHIPLTYPDGSPILQNGVQVYAVDKPLYLGPIILTKRSTPVRVKFTNYLPLGAAGNLPIPVDTTIMGAGMGPLDMPGMPGMKENYTQNRADLHLHGGLSPWISDGTPHQWITPAGEMTQYPKGVSMVNVPDMPEPGPGSQTYYWTNEQSARLMFYHDHSWGITRLNVYCGEAAGYMITDPVEEDLITRGILPNLGGLYRYGIPLVIQDKSFVNDATTPKHQTFPAGYTPIPKTADVDPLWYTHIPGSKGGNLWFPHEYLPNENIYDPSGFWALGRWDYGPWILPPMIPMNDILPSPSHVPEAFMDTAVVNGAAFPYVELPPTAVRFRILNACNDRMLNLQLYKADPNYPTEVKMVPADPNPVFPTWPKDGRDGGVPDPTTAGPPWVQIGNECGFLAQVAVIPAQPVDYDYDRTSATFGSVGSVSLFLPPAVRADVIADLSQYKDGDTLILYNDAPAPAPLYDSRYDYQTNDPADRTVKGGAPMIPPGFGPNTRTLMQIRIKGTPSGAYNLPALQAALPKAFAAAQEHPIVPAAAFNDAYGTQYTDTYANIADYTLNVSGAAATVGRVQLELPGFGYTSPPTVRFAGGGGTGAVAVASLNGVTGIVLTAGGMGYTSPPAVVITPAAGDTGTGAAAQAIVSGGAVTTVVVTNPGSNYLQVPTVTLTGGGGMGATALGNITIGSVGAITVTNSGSGYTKAPYVSLVGGRGMGATAIAVLSGGMVLDGKNLVEGMDMEYGRMNAVLGSTPSLLTPTVGAGPIIGAGFYIDPPTEVLQTEQPCLWRLMHLGVDSHSLHFHLFDVQVVNRVDWTNTLKPPYPEEIGWKETIRTNPFEDIIVALRPKASAMRLSYGCPESNRVLDPSMPEGTMGHFQPVMPPPGIPAVAQTMNVMTNFGWEYVWHCHLLGHEENDMMRPLVLKVPCTTPSAPVLSATTSGNQINLSWQDPTPVGAVSTPGNPANEIGFHIERATGTAGAFSLVANALSNQTTYSEARPGTGSYRYRVTTFNSVGTAVSNTVTVAPTVAAPTSLTAVANSGQQVALSWRDNANNETGFVVERAISGGAFAQIAAPGPRTGTGNVGYTDNTVSGSTTYIYRVKAMNGATSSAYTNEVTVTTPAAPPGVPATPGGLTATAVRAGLRDNVTLNWTDNSNNETTFTIQRATNLAFTSNLVTVSSTVAANAVSFVNTSVSRRTTFYYRIRADGTGGSSAWSASARVVTP